LNGIVSGKYSLLSQPQLDVLQWIADGCPPSVRDGDGHKLVARGLANRNLVAIRRIQGRWSADMLPGGEYYLAHNDFDPVIKQRERTTTTATVVKRPKTSARLSPLAATTDEAPPEVEDVDIDGTANLRLPPADVTVRAMRRAARKRSQPTQFAPNRMETAMRYTVMVTRVQVAERSVHAVDEESAARKVQEEFDRPYGYFGTWKTVSSEVEVTEKESVLSTMPHAVSKDGGMLLGLKDAGKALGVSYSTVYELVNKGDLEHVSIGSRRYIAREVLLQFIEKNTYRGFHRLTPDRARFNAERAARTCQRHHPLNVSLRYCSGLRTVVRMG